MLINLACAVNVSGATVNVSAQMLHASYWSVDVPYLLLNDSAHSVNVSGATVNVSAQSFNAYA